MITWFLSRYDCCSWIQFELKVMQKESSLTNQQSNVCSGREKEKEKEKENIHISDIVVKLFHCVQTYSSILISNDYIIWPLLTSSMTNEFIWTNNVFWNETSWGRIFCEKGRPARHSNSHMVVLRKSLAPYRAGCLHVSNMMRFNRASFMLHIQMWHQLKWTVLDCQTIP